MKSAFGSKRKARKIEVEEDDDGGANQNRVESLSPSIKVATISLSGKKTLKKSSLRQSIIFDNQDDNEGNNENEHTTGRSNSTLKKKKAATSRLSFGPGEIFSGDAAEVLEDDHTFAPKISGLGRQVIESKAFPKSLPIVSRERDVNDEERPTYSKDYLNELKSSTPNTPKALQSLQAGVEDEGLDDSELEGAMIVDSDSASAYIPSEAEIREKKERRARLAHEHDFISLNDDGRSDGSQLSLLLRKKKPESRLVREDEDLGEGFDEFVDDGRISLGKKQEREARRRHRKEMADMIQQAEGSEDDESDDSEAERRAAYEVAQTRAGMDGLRKPDDNGESLASQVPSKITPLPVLSECLARLQTTMSNMELDMSRRRKRLEELEKDKSEILIREKEVQELLKQAGNAYAAARGSSNGAVADPQKILDAHSYVLPDRLVADRGLESFGNTPVARQEVEDAD